MPSAPSAPSSQGQLPDAGQLPLLVPLRDVRQDPVRGPGAHGVADGEVLGVEQVVEAQGVPGSNGGSFAGWAGAVIRTSGGWPSGTTGS